MPVGWNAAVDVESDVYRGGERSAELDWGQHVRGAGDDNFVGVGRGVAAREHCERWDGEPDVQLSEDGDDRVAVPEFV